MLKPWRDDLLFDGDRLRREAERYRSGSARGFIRAPTKAFDVDGETF